MPFDIADRIRDGLGLSEESGTSFEDVDRPDDVTVERVTADLEDAVANGDLTLERTGFDDESALLTAVDPMVGDYHAHHDAIGLLNQFQTGWESDTHGTYSDAVEEAVDDEVVTAVDRHTPQIVSVLEGFGEAEPFEWVTSYVGEYPHFGCLVEYVFAYSELDERGYLE
jgi:hypothetical protein